jgi:hypothetical protein
LSQELFVGVQGDGTKAAKPGSAPPGTAAGTAPPPTGSPFTSAT